MKLVRPIEEAGLLIKSVSERIENEAKEEKGRFLGMLLGRLGRLGASVLRNLLTSTTVMRSGDEGTNAGKGTISQEF